MLLGTAVHATCFFFLVCRLDWNSEAQKAAARVGIPKRASKIMKHLISDDEDIEQGGFEENEGTAYWQTDFTEFGRSRGQPTSRN